MSPIPEAVRLTQGCGYLPRMEGARPDFGIPLEAGVEVTVCPGYSTSLPEVVETVRYRPSYLKGYMVAHVRDCSEAMFDAQAVLEGAVNTHQAYEAEQRRKEAEAKRHGQ